jgi:hypothetical protein
MARITNSNLLRLGSNLSWNGVQSLNYSLFVSGYLPYFLERSMLYGVDEALQGPGPVAVKHLQGRHVVLLTIYNFLIKSPGVYSFKRLRTLGFLILLRCLAHGLRRHYLPSKLVLCFRPYQDWDATFTLNYFKLRLGQDFQVFSILSTLRRLLSRVPGLLGYRIDITGRYARQQRATKLSIKRGVITLSEFSANITYVEDFVILKHGKCGFKVWLNRLPSNSVRSSVFQL